MVEVRSRDANSEILDDGRMILGIRHRQVPFMVAVHLWCVCWFVYEKRHQNAFVKIARTHGRT
jgi:hypothetical protein